MTDTPDRVVDYPSHLAGQLAGHLALATRMEQPLVALGGPTGRALMRIVAEAFEPSEWPGLHHVEEELRAKIAAHLAERIADMESDEPPGGYM